ncbi:5182_t:CDS:1, partial [Cetraspora pellucida]
MKRDRIALTVNEKIMLISLHHYFQKNALYKKSNLSKEVSLATGVSERSVYRVLAEYKKIGQVLPPKYNRRPPK